MIEKTYGKYIWDDFPFSNCSLFVDWIENQTSSDSDISNSDNR